MRVWSPHFWCFWTTPLSPSLPSLLAIGVLPCDLIYTVQQQLHSARATPGVELTTTPNNKTLIQASDGGLMEAHCWSECVARYECGTYTWSAVLASTNFWVMVINRHPRTKVKTINFSTVAGVTGRPGVFRLCTERCCKKVGQSENCGHLFLFSKV